MISVEKQEAIRRAYFVEKKGIREISRDLECSRPTVRKAIASAEPITYTLKKPRAAPVLGPYKARIKELLAENEDLPRKQHYTGRRIFQVIKKEGYPGSESTVRGYIAKQRKAKKKPKVYLPLEFDPGTDAQVDWGEATVIIQDERVQIQLFLMRLCYSRRLFVMAFPCQKQEAFFEGHVRAFHFFGGVPHRISYDNLKAAVKRILEGRNREEQKTFVVFRSHYLFESHFCNRGKGNEKGRVEDGVGFARRNFLVPLPRVESFEELNDYLLDACQADDERRIDRQPVTIGEAWEMEKPYLLPLPLKDPPCCATKMVSLNGFCQVQFETNRYSVPYDDRHQNLVLKAYPFRVDILYLDEVIASHPRCYGHKQDVLDPLHYLPLLEQRPGAFEHAQPIRRWRENWPPIYEELLAELQAKWPEGRGVREFVRILKLHQEHPANLLKRAIEQALQYKCAHADGVELCLRQLLNPELQIPAIQLGDWPRLAAVNAQTPDLQRYNQLLGGG
jgi:transposase